MFEVHDGLQTSLICGLYPSGSDKDKFHSILLCDTSNKWGSTTLDIIDTKSDSVNESLWHLCNRRVSSHKGHIIVSEDLEQAHLSISLNSNMTKIYRSVRLETFLCVSSRKVKVPRKYKASCTDLLFNLFTY